MGVVKVKGVTGGVAGGVVGGGLVNILHLPVTGSKSHTTPLISTSTDITPFQVTLISVFSPAGKSIHVTAGTSAQQGQSDFDCCCEQDVKLTQKS